MITKINNLRIIKYNSKYKNKVIELIGNILRELKVIPFSPKPLDDEDLYQIPSIYKNRGCFWLALEGEQLVGTIGIKETNKDKAKLKRMFVDKKYRGTGIAKLLLDTAINFAKFNKYKEIVLNTHINMKRAHGFYEKNGFVKIGEGPDKYHYRFELT